MPDSESDLAPVAPLLIGPRNCEAAIGQLWRWTRRFAEQAGVPIWRLGTKTAIPAAQLMRAFEAHVAATQPAPRELTDEEREDVILARMGLERVPGAARSSGALADELLGPDWRRTQRFDAAAATQATPTAPASQLRRPRAR